jgi:hypothetical protein
MDTAQEDHDIEEAPPNSEQKIDLDETNDDSTYTRKDVETIIKLFEQSSGAKTAAPARAFRRQTHYEDDLRKFAQELQELEEQESTEIDNNTNDHMEEDKTIALHISNMNIELPIDTEPEKEQEDKDLKIEDEVITESNEVAVLSNEDENKNDERSQQKEDSIEQISTNIADNVEQVHQDSVSADSVTVDIDNDPKEDKEEAPISSEQIDNNNETNNQQILMDKLLHGFETTSLQLEQGISTIYIKLSQVYCTIR